MSRNNITLQYKFICVDSGSVRGEDWNDCAVHTYMTRRCFVDDIVDANDSDSDAHENNDDYGVWLHGSNSPPTVTVMMTIITMITV